MKSTRLLMGMPITVEIVDDFATQKDIEDVFNYFISVDKRFSTYKKDSEISKINDGLDSGQARMTLNQRLKSASHDMQEIFRLAEITKKETHGYFDIVHNGIVDPSGIVKGWAIDNAARILKKKNFKNYYVEAGGDVQVSGKNVKEKLWKVGIKNPFKQEEVVKVLQLTDKGIATSGTYIRGSHIYNPKNSLEITDIVSLTVVAKNIYDADRMCTAAFAMGKKGIDFIEGLRGYEGYMITKNGIGIQTSGFSKYALP